ncbi:MAG TPA: C40 family peptidase [Gemmatimonadales bacterium]|jgi:cell wall-associated NlpC family hydrolase|nr:C40 family peptidase [Gemmatimonadales bacterium]
MSSVVVTAAVAPVHAEPSVRAEQVTQLVLGETASIREDHGEWLAIRSDVDGYQGWMNAGYLRRLDAAALGAWTTAAASISLGARITLGKDVVHAPLRARLAEDDGLITLPDGRAGRLLDGGVRRADELARALRNGAPHAWALEQFRGTSYLWGGLTPLGVDCSGLVQTTYLLRGQVLARDSSVQATAGTAVPLDGTRPGDLLFFHGEKSSGITHVAFAAEGDTIIHSTISCGGVLQESFQPGTRAGEQLRPRLVAVRRIAG